MAAEKVACRTPAKGRDGVTNIPRWKFDVVRAGILQALGAGEMRFSELSGAVGARLDAEDLARLGSVSWHVTTVKLELEMRGEIERVGRSGPQILRRVRQDGER